MSMRLIVLLVAMLPVAILLGGCMGSGGGGKTTPYEPRVREFDIYVHAGATDTVGLYMKNDLNQSRSVAVTFKSDPDDPQIVPGPEIRAKEGDTVIIRLHNLNPLDHTIHLHGDPGKVTWENDGVDFLTQLPVEQGEMYEYRYENLKAGTYWYHCHVDGAHHIDLGMYGAFIVEEVDPQYEYDREYTVILDEWDNCHVHGNRDPLTGQEATPDSQDQTQCFYRYLLDNLAQNQQVAQIGQTVNDTVPQGARDAYCPTMITAFQNVPEPARSNALLAAGCLPPHAHGTPPPQQTPKQWWPVTHPVYNPEYNTFLVNGHAFPDTPAFPVKYGEKVLFRIINAGSQVHTWHPHGHTMVVTHKDGYPLAHPILMDTLSISPGERYDYIMEMDNPGLWMIHDQNGMATVNDNVHPGGMMACFAYDGFHDIDAFAMTRALDCNTEAMKILGGHMNHTM